MDTQAYKRFIYWIPAAEITAVREDLHKHGYKFTSVLGSQCEVLKAKEKTLGYGTPDAFNRLCKRQGSWYRESNKAGMHVIARELVLSRCN
jgi:hypothetical protein